MRGRQPQCWSPSHPPAAHRATTLASEGGPVMIHTPYTGTPGLRHGQDLAQGHRAEGAECLGFEPGSADS